MPTGLGDEKLWLCPTLNNVTPFNDLSVQGNHGTAVGGLSTVADSDLTYGGSRAYDFDGTDDYIDAPTSVVEGLSTGAISMWFKADSSASGTRRFLMSAGAGAAGQDATYFDIGPSTSFFNNESLGAAVLNSSQSTVLGGFYRNGESFFFDDSWHHVVYMSDSTGNSMYIDGVLVSLSYTGGSSASTQALFRTGLTRFYIGVRDWNGLSGFFSGHQDDVRVYNRTLTQVEITHLSSKRGVLGSPPKGLGDEQLWLCPSLQDSANDLSNSNNNGTYNGGMGTISDSSKGGSRCYNFDGVDDYIDVTSSDVPAAAYTVSLWQYSTSSAITTAFNAGQVGGERTVNIDGVRAGLSGDNHGHKRGSTSYWASNPTVRISATWYHYLLTYDGSEIRLYVDGVYTANRTGVQDTDWIEDRCWIGQYMGGSYFFQGRIDDIRTYNRVLTPSEIAHLTSSRGIQGHPTIKGLGDEKLWLCPSLNDSANDISGNANDGTLNGGMSIVTDVDTTYKGTKAFEFDGIDDYVSLPDVAIIQGTTSQFSTSTWVKMDSAAASDPSWPYVTKYSFGYNRRNSTFPQKGYESFFLYYLNTFSIDLRLTNWDNAYGLWNRYTLSTSPNNTWLNICVTYDGSLSPSGLKLFVDGTELSHTNYRNNLSVTSLVNEGPPLIGKGGEPMKFSFGLQDDLRVYDRALNQEEIAHLAKSRGVLGGPYNLNGIKHLLSSFIHPLG